MNTLRESLAPIAKDLVILIRDQGLDCELTLNYLEKPIRALIEANSAEADLAAMQEENGRLRVQNERLKSPLSKVGFVGARMNWKDRYFDACDLCHFLRSRAEKSEARAEELEAEIEQLRK